jgi:hypothetical protein
VGPSVPPLPAIEPTGTGGTACQKTPNTLPSEGKGQRSESSWVRQLTFEKKRINRWNDFLNPADTMNFVQRSGVDAGDGGEEWGKRTLTSQGQAKLA